MTFITIDDELKMGLRIHPGHKAWVRDFYEQHYKSKYNTVHINKTKQIQYYHWNFICA